MIDDRHPVVVGVGQVTWRDQIDSDANGPLELMVEATARAVGDTGADVIAHVDHLTVVNVFAWDYGNAPALLADRLGLDDRADRRYLGVGGHSAQRAVNDIASRLAAGELELAIVAGAEVLAGKQAARRVGHRVDWGRHPDPLPQPEARAPEHPAETAGGLLLPIWSYPLWEPALRVAAGRSPDEQSAHIGRLMARFTEVAAANPYAWFARRRTAEELMTVRDDNRMVSSPYTKLVNSIIRVDQGAALVLTTVGRARDLGMTPDRWVYVLGGGDGEDVWYLTERPGYSASSAMARVADQAWRSSGLGVDDVAHFDLYSCFPSAVQLAMGAYGVAEDDPRPMTVTGGLPYAGGPGNNYTTHSTAAMVEKLREDPGEVGLVTGLGWHVTRHSAGLYGSRPPERPFALVDPGPDRVAVESEPHPVIEAEPSGRATVEGYSVAYDREGGPETARCLARLDAGRRSLVTSDDPTVAAAMTDGEWYGREIEVTPDLRFRT